MKIKILMITFFLCYGVLPGRVISDEIYHLKFIQQDITLDGVLDESVWEQVPPLTFVSHWPTYGKEPSQDTDIRICYDTEYLYVAARFAEIPDGIQGPTYKRDKWNMTMDQIGISLDTFNDNESALLFIVTPTGSRIDATINNDAQSTPAGGWYSANWNTYWDAKVTTTRDEWLAEVRIPFSSLRFQDVGGTTEMGLMVYRYRATDVELMTFPAIQPKWGGSSFLKPSQAQKIQITNVQNSNPLYITPYVLGGSGYNAVYSASEASYRRDKTQVFDIGGDLKYGLTKNYTLDVTYNTDFAQVEADDQQVNLTRYSLFFPEKRQFFLERASIFNFNFGESDRLFYSRQIGLQEGRAIPIIGGARVVGRSGHWDVGLLDMHTQNQDGLSGENFGILRLKRRVLNEYSSVGTMVTTRLSEQGRKNVAVGMDGLFRLFSDDYLTLKWAHTFDSERSGSIADFRTSRIHALWERRTYEDLGYQLRYDRAGALYYPGVGFELRDNYTRLGSRVSYGWLLNDHPAIQQWQVAVSGHQFIRNLDHSLESAEVSPMVVMEWKQGNRMEIRANWFQEHLDRPFHLTDRTIIGADTYQFSNLQVIYNTPRSQFFTTEYSVTTGTFYDNFHLATGVQPSWVISRHFTLTGGYHFDFIDFPEHTFRSHVGRLRIEAALNRVYSIYAYIQYNSIAADIITNIRFRINPKEGTDLYLVYTEGVNTDRYGNRPVLPLSQNRTILLKYSHTFLF